MHRFESCRGRLFQKTRVMVHNRVDGADLLWPDAEPDPGITSWIGRPGFGCGRDRSDPVGRWARIRKRGRDLRRCPGRRVHYQHSLSLPSVEHVWKARFQRLDHTWIYALVAATFTALLVGSLDGPPVGIGISLIWGIGALGALKEFLPRTRNRWTLLTQIALGAGLVAPMVLMLEWHGAEVVGLTVVGSIAYLVGMLMMIRHWPRLLPRIFSYHEVFHIIVIAAAMTHFVAVREVISTA